MSDAIVSRILEADYAPPCGSVTALGQGFVAADGPAAGVGDYCSIDAAGTGTILAEVVSVSRTGLRLSPLAPTRAISLGAKVVRMPGGRDFPAGDAFAGRAIDALGRPIDGLGDIGCSSQAAAASATRVEALDRAVGAARFTTGIRAIDGLLPMAQGQRVGIFAASGVGKTSLIEQLLEQAQFDRAVICLVGERGREVAKVWDAVTRGDRGSRVALVAATADESPALRVRAIEQALALAEHWRAEGKDVLLLVDSISRVATALREIGLAAGEPPAARGYTANVFSAVPRLVERCGAVRGGGAVTAILSVLSETDDVDDPIVELMKSVLDGHIVLSRSLAERRHYPAIDIARSVSRLSDELLSEEQAEAAANVFRLHATYEEARPMIESGLYVAGSSSEIDRAIEAHPHLMRFLRQGRRETCSIDETEAELTAVTAGAHHVA
ncbi:FliI/YscN family ATPase [Pelagerythrobacter marensis]|uniref:Flagellar protein FliI n=1 Tax=Pelagerythrobacter marensis TaxID=543877 RepID=A0A0G3XC34_9SPHN|nr:FliI/YscN family ATPase [Pelagerythrobacter marensis]AKM07968.1 flagellar protein FliI [Pelagerythrobacter marensis]